MMSRKTPVILIVLACIASCNTGGELSPDPVITPDKGRIELPSEFQNAQDSSFTVLVNSNVSWFAHLNDKDHPIDPSDPGAALDWVSMDVQEHENLTKVGDEVALRLTVRRNKSTVQRNGVLNFWSGGKVFTSVEISQSAAVYHLSAYAGREMALCTPDTLVVNVVSNTEWSAEVVDDGGTGARLSRNGGADSDTLSLMFGENFDLFRKSVQLRLAAEGCQPVVLTLSQSEAVPYLELDLNDFDGFVAPDATEFLLPVKTNCSGLEAVLKEGATLSDAALSRVSEKAFRLSFTPDGTDPFVLKNAVVLLTADGAEPLEVGISQRGRIELEFNTTADATVFSPALVTAAAQELSLHGFTVGENVYQFGMFGIYFREANRAMFFYKGGYMALPAVPGFTLTKITIKFRGHASNHSARLTIKGTGDDAETLYSPKDMNLPVPTGTNDYVDHTIVVGEGSDNKPAPGVSYRVCQHNNSTCLIRHITLQYE